MKTVTASAADRLGKFLSKDVHRIFGSAYNDAAERLGSFARSTIEYIGKSDALYHNYEHTMLVTLVGREILQGMIRSQRIEPSDYTHLIVSCLLHDIGYVRGALSGDTADEFIADMKGGKVRLPRGASDAALTPYHVDRSKLFALERFRHSPACAGSRVADAIEATRSPPQLDQPQSQEARMVRAADLIGQMGAPFYTRKATPFFCEFEKIGMNRHLGYSSPADIVDQYPRFF